MVPMGNGGGPMPTHALPSASTQSLQQGLPEGCGYACRAVAGTNESFAMPLEQGNTNAPMVPGLEDVDVFSILDAAEHVQNDQQVQNVQNVQNVQHVQHVQHGAGEAGGPPTATATACPVTGVANVVHPAMMQPATHGCGMAAAYGAHEWDPSAMGASAAAQARSVKGSKADGTLQKQGWTPEEDATIVRMVQLTGQKWSFIACALPGRTDDAVRNRYLRLQKKTSSSQCVTNADLADCQATKKGDMWTAEEDARIMEGVRLHGYKWQQIASVLPGRSANAVRNRFLRCSPESAAGAAAGVPPTGTGDVPHGQYAMGMADHSGLPTLHGMPMHGMPMHGMPMHSMPMQGMQPQMMQGMPMPPQGMSMPLGSMGGGGMIGDELMVPPGGGQGVNFFWDASALYGEALGAIHDDLFAAGGDERGS